MTHDKIIQNQQVNQAGRIEICVWKTIGTEDRCLRIAR